MNCFSSSRVIYVLLSPIANRGDYTIRSKSLEVRSKNLKVIDGQTPPLRHDKVVPSVGMTLMGVILVTPAGIVGWICL
jgi:hypothetical protein